MTREEARKEILELLARGKITLDEAVTLLDQTGSGPTAKGAARSDEEPPLKVDVDVDVDIDVEKETPSRFDQELEIEEIPYSTKEPGKEAHWLRIHVADLQTGKNKVRVNIPLGMVKFGLGIAQCFAPEEYCAGLDQIGAMMSGAESGLLVDVKDEEDNEHVRIYFD